MTNEEIDIEYDKLNLHTEICQKCRKNMSYSDKENAVNNTYLRPWCEECAQTYPLPVGLINSIKNP